MLTVACVLSRGPRRAYGPEHVERLREQVAEHLAEPHEFVCVDDSPYPGWWAKVSLFEPGRFSGRVLYLDLDVTVVGPLGDLAAFPHPLAACRDFLSLRVNSSVMAWDAGSFDDLCDDFSEDVMERLHGDQDWFWERRARDFACFPRHWCVSYKVATLTQEWPDDMRVIVFHGAPKPWEIPCSAR